MFLQMIKQLTEQISKSIKEGTITVYVKAANKEVPFSVTTYFVDYDQDIGFPGGAGGAGGGP